MIYRVYSVFDRKVEAFMQPFMARTDGEACRMFIASFEQENASRIPAEDMELFFVSEWNDGLGEYGVPEDQRLHLPKLVLTGVSAEGIANKSRSPGASPHPL